MRDSDPLCCCEYINNKNERSHLLACCCNCEELDICVDRLVTCKRISWDHMGNIVSTINDRCRIPWRGGAKQISVDSFLPILLLPFLMYIAALNVWFTIFAFLLTLTCLLYMYYIFSRKYPQTKFFCVWTIVSIILLVLIFEMNVVPLLEILPEENIAFIFLSVFSLFCLYKVWANSRLNKVTYNDSRDDLLGNRNKATEVVCSVCRKRVPPRTFHCNICHTCILKKNHHCVWLDCCIGEKNHCIFILGLTLSCCTLIYSASLTLTSVCRPFLFMEIISLPDDCSDVYHDSEIALCFVNVLYCLLTACLALYLLGHHCWLISIGLTTQEWYELPVPERRCWGLRAIRPYNRGVLCNWFHFLCCWPFVPVTN